MANARGEKMRFHVENAKLKFENFTGRPGKFNAAGVRSFAVVIDDPETAERLAADEWPVKYPKQHETDGDDDEETRFSPHLPIGVRFDKKPPRVILVSSKARVVLEEKDIAVLDAIDIERCDLVANASWWFDDRAQEWKVKAYLKSMIVWIDEDPLEKKYADIFAEAMPGEKIAEEVGVLAPGE